MPSRRALIRLLGLAGLAVVLAAPSVAMAASVNEQREKVRTQSAEVLAHLYKTTPGARGVVEQAAGYATFHRFGIKIGVAGGGLGRGLAVDRTGKETFMKFVEVSAGLGLGIKSYDLVFVFDTEQAMSDFINKGWEYGGQATAAAKASDSGRAYSGAHSVSPDVRLYQITERGLSADISVAGTRYLKDEDLNAR